MGMVPGSDRYAVTAVRANRGKDDSGFDLAAGTFARVVDSWEGISAIVLIFLSLRFLSVPYTGASPFDNGLYRVMEVIFPVPEVWGAIMLASVPAAFWAVLFASPSQRLAHRLWMAFAWGMFAGANIPLGLDASLRLTGIIMLWAMAGIAVLQAYAYVDFLVRSGWVIKRARRET